MQQVGMPAVVNALPAKQAMEKGVHAHRVLQVNRQSQAGRVQFHVL